MAFGFRLARPLSLNNRVMLFVALAISLSLVVIGHLVQKSVVQHFAEQDADELVVISHAVAEALKKTTRSGRSADETLPDAVSGHHGVYYQVWDESGALVYGPHEVVFPPRARFNSSVDTIRADNLVSWHIDDKFYRGAMTQVQIDGRNYLITAAINMDFHIRFLEHFSRNLWLIMALAGGLTLLAAWYGVHQGHAPLRALSESIRSVQADQLDMRLNEKAVPMELQPLVESFNQMISRLDDSFTRLSHFSADIAHELRTPLTNLATQTQVGLGQARTLEEYRELLYSNLEEQERLTKMVNDMLWLAQSENGLLKPSWEFLDIRQEVEATFEFFEALAEDKKITLAVGGDRVNAMADRSMLRRVISNLLSNALRYTPENETINILVEGVDNQVHISIENPGQGIPEDHLPKLFDRFYRVDPSRQRQSEGAGLGLAIVKSIVEAHAGTVAVSSKRGSTRFVISLPKNEENLG